MLSSEHSSGCKDPQFCQHKGIWCLLFRRIRKSSRCVQRKQDLRNVKANSNDCSVGGKLKGDWMSFPERCDCKHVFCRVSACFMCVSVPLLRRRPFRSLERWRCASLFVSQKHVLLLVTAKITQDTITQFRFGFIVLDFSWFYICLM